MAWSLALDRAERERRLAICRTCPELRKKPGKRLLPLPVQEIEHEVCGHCGCPIIGKSFTGCPLGKFTHTVP